MSSVIEICNTALGHIGADQFIADLTETTSEAKNCALHYDPARRELLEDFPYNFARGVVALAALTSDAPPGWGFAYRYPDGCLQARAVTDSSGTRYRWDWRAACCTSWDDWALSIAGRVPWEVMHDAASPGSRQIVTDIEEAYLWYTVDVDQVNQMTSLFRDALAWKLAVRLAGPLRVNANLRASLQSMLDLAVSKAQAMSLNEAQTVRAPESPSIQARW
jgi:hypothetical protein